MSKELKSSYIGSNGIVETKIARNRKSPVAAILSASMSVVLIMIILQPILASFFGNFQNDSNSNNGVVTYAEAGEPGIFCSAYFGSGMNNKKSWNGIFDSNSFPNLGNRELTLQEAFGRGIDFVMYDGEGEAADRMFVKSKETPTPSNRVLGNSSSDFTTLFEKNKERLESVRTFGGCFGSWFLPQIANGTLMIAHNITGLAQFTSAMVFNSDLVCTDGNKDYCLDLVSIIGGDGSADGGLIGVLTSSIYYPLLVIAVALTGLWVVKKGLIDRKLREALFGVIWVVLSVIFGLGLLLNPGLITKAPMAVSNIVSTCVIGAFNGQNCFDGGSSASIDYESGNGSSSENICRSSSLDANATQQMSFTTNSITCSIWRAFVLEPAAQGSFGTSFNELDVYANPQLNALLVAEGLDPAAYCVNLGSSQSLEDMEGGYLKLDSSRNRVCNLMAYQMYLKVKATTNGDTNVSEHDEKWYRVIMATAADDGLWSHWSNEGAGFDKLGVAFIALMASGMGTFIIFITSIMALVYYISSVLLMAFAPLFFLLGVHPGKGKSMLIGWFEKVVSNVLKYMASAVFLIVAISIYGGILGSINNIGLTLIFVIIVTMALFMYRNELLSLLGRASMGGEQLSNSLSEKLGGKAKSFGKSATGIAVAGAGGVVGAALTTDGRMFDKEMRHDLTAGFKDGVKRQTKRGTGFVSNIARQYDRNTVDNKSDLNSKSIAAATDFDQKDDKFVTDKGRHEKLVEERTEAHNTAEAEATRLGDLEYKHDRVKAIESLTLNEYRDSIQRDKLVQTNEINNSDMSASEKAEQLQLLENTQKEALDYSTLQAIQNAIRDDKIALDVSVSLKNDIESDRLREKIADSSASAAAIRSRISEDNYDRSFNDYKNALNSKLDGEQLTFTSDDINQLAGSMIAVGTQKENLDIIDRKTRESADELAALERDRDMAKVSHEIYNDEFIALRPGEGLHDRKIGEIERRVETAREVRNEELARKLQENSDEYENNGNNEPVVPNRRPTTFNENNDQENYFEKNNINTLDTSRRGGGRNDSSGGNNDTPPDSGGGIPRSPDTPPNTPPNNGGGNQQSPDVNPKNPPKNPPNAPPNGGGKREEVADNQVPRRVRPIDEEHLKENESDYIAERKAKMDKESRNAPTSPKTAPVRDDRSSGTQTPTRSPQGAQRGTQRKSGIPTSPGEVFQRAREKETKEPKIDEDTE